MKKNLCFVFCAILLCGVSFAGDFSGGSGTSNDPYLISTAAELAALNSNPFYLGNSFRLVADVDMSGIAFAPVGTAAKPFRGAFNGDNFTISSITINATNDYAGIFGFVDCNSQVRNLKVSNIAVNAASSTYVGAIAGYNKGALINCDVSDSVVIGKNGVGGICGLNEWQIRYCDVTNTLISGMSGIGGIAGYNRGGYIYLCTAATTLSGGDYVGGIAGSQDSLSTIFRCGSNSTLSGNDYVGGITGLSLYSYITDCTCSGTISGSVYTGGISGYSHDSIFKGSTTDAMVTGDTFVGGIAGYNKFGKITTTLTLCTVTGRQDAGEFFGANIGGVFVPCQVVYSDGDLNRDGVVDEEDFFFFIAHWLAEGAGLTADLNLDGIVNWVDFGILANYQ